MAYNRRVGTSDRVTVYLRQMLDGDSAAADELFPEVYSGLRAIADGLFRGQRRELTLQPTALVHEAYLRLVGEPERGFESRRHFYRVAARAMRQLLVDYARARRTEKRGGDREVVELRDEELAGDDGLAGIDLVALDDALTRLAGLSERQARIVELRYLAGLSVDETADVLEVSRRTVLADWKLARLWLERELASDGA